jgi:KaiC/GvpD/RAD55 family RecA-like ATPase
MASSVLRKKFNTILVDTDNPEFLEEQIAPQKDVFALNNINFKDLRARYKEQHNSFSTCPADATGRDLRFYPGGFTIWSGDPGAGKTTFLRQLVCHLMYGPNPQGVFVASLEETPEKVFVRHACAALGTENPSEDGFEWCADSWLEHLSIWNYSAKDSDAEHARILAAIRVLARDRKVRHAFIDSFMCLDVPENDLEAQRKFSIKLTQTCALAGVHLHLVCHPRKKQRADAAITMDDVAGSAHLVRKCDNLAVVKRATNERESSTPDATAMLISVLKQREYPGRTCELSGWYNRNYKQFSADQFQETPVRYLPEMAYERRVAQDPLF